MTRMWEYRPLLTVLLYSRVELKEPEACSNEYKPVRQFPDGTEYPRSMGSKGHVRPREVSWRRALGLSSRTEIG